MEGKTVKWNGANGLVEGTVVKQTEEGSGDYLVLLQSGKYVVVNESSFIL